MPDERFLVTGALGCIGSWVVRVLRQEGVPVCTLDLAVDPHRMRLIMSDAEMAQVNFISGDITDLDCVERAIKDNGITQVIHLAALQVPFCKADPPLGARVNVVGTVNVFEAARRAGLQRVVYASSVAVYGLSEEYQEGKVDDAAPLHPQSLYGVYKQANEGTARIYWQDNGITSIGLRPYIVYGPGRDQGMTSGPTKAMLAAALGKPYHIPFGGRGVYQYTEDIARIFIQATRVPFQGADVFLARGPAVHMREIVDAIEAAQPAARGQITFADTPLTLPADVDDSRLRAVFGRVPETPLGEGVAETIRIYQAAQNAGRMPPG
jgi:nucleoside-diphosphate-sugar epimerase